MNIVNFDKDKDVIFCQVKGENKCKTIQPLLDAIKSVKKKKHFIVFYDDSVEMTIIKNYK